MADTLLRERMRSSDPSEMMNVVGASFDITSGYDWYSPPVQATTMKMPLRGSTTPLIVTDFIPGHLLNTWVHGGETVVTEKDPANWVGAPYRITVLDECSMGISTPDSPWATSASSTRTGYFLLPLRVRDIIQGMIDQHNDDWAPEDNVGSESEIPLSLHLLADAYNRAFVSSTREDVPLSVDPDDYPVV